MVGCVSGDVTPGVRSRASGRQHSRFGRNRNWEVVGATADVRLASGEPAQGLEEAVDVCSDARGTAQHRGCRHGESDTAVKTLTEVSPWTVLDAARLRHGRRWSAPAPTSVAGAIRRSAGDRRTPTAWFREQHSRGASFGAAGKLVAGSWPDRPGGTRGHAPAPRRRELERTTREDGVGVRGR